MYKLIALLFIGCCMQLTATSQIKWANPQPSGYHCSKILFTDTTTGYILNVNGDLLKTSNQGGTWEIVHNFYATKVFDLHDSTGIIAGYNAIYVSSDNGSTWSKSPAGFADDMVDVDVVSRDTIFMAGTYKLYKSVDRGQSWQTINLLQNVITTSFDFVNSKIGFIGRSNTSMLKTVDGGLTWQEILPRSLSSSAFYAVKFLNTDTGYAYRENDTLYKTTDCGITWQRYFIPSDIYSIQFITPAIGFLAGEYGSIWRTGNGGTSWSPISTTAVGYNTILRAVYFVSPTTGFVAGYGGRISKTGDGGLSWKHNAISYVDITGLAFPGSGTGYATSLTTAFKTTDGANTWSPLAIAPTGTSSFFQNAYFFTKDTGYFGSTFPARMYKTNNGGQTWRTINFTGPFTGSTYEENSGTSIINDSVAIMNLMSGSYGYAIYKTTNRGETWKKIDSARPLGQVFRQIHFFDEKTGYALRGYQLYRTVDSTRNWSLVSTNNNTIQTLYFLNAKTGFIGDNDGIKRTNDSGRTWAALPVNGSIYGSPAVAIRFVSGSLGYYTSSAGKVFQTLDSGRTWKQYGSIPATSKLMTLQKDTLLYIGGTAGTIAAIAVDTIMGTRYGCQGSTFTFISDISNSNSNYQWQVDTGTGFINIYNSAIYSGANAAQLIVHNVPPAWTNYRYRCWVDYFSYSRVYAFRFRTQWSGAISTAWENGGNWSCGVVPDNNTDVIITSGSVVVNNNTTIRSLQLSPGVSFTVSPGVSLTILH